MEKELRQALFEIRDAESAFHDTRKRIKQHHRKMVTQVARMLKKVYEAM